MRKRKALEDRVTQLERDWSPLINAALGDTAQAESRMREAFRAQIDELVRLQVDYELVKTDHERRITELEVSMEDVKPKRLFGTRRETA